MRTVLSEPTQFQRRVGPRIKHIVWTPEERDDWIHQALEILLEAVDVDQLPVRDREYVEEGRRCLEKDCELKRWLM